MTCIVAVTDGRSVLLGGDSAGAAGQELRIRADPKVFMVGSYVIGFTTSFRMGQILRYTADLPDPPPDTDSDRLHGFLVAQLIPALRRSFAEEGFLKRGRQTSAKDPNLAEEGQELGGMFLLGVAGRIFEVSGDFHIGCPSAPYSAVGSGALTALGALHALESSQELSLRQRAASALAASEAYCASVRGPYHFIQSSPDAG